MTAKTSELPGNPRPKSSKLDRRQFLVRAGGGLTLGFFCSEILRPIEVRAQSNSAQVNTWLNIGSNGTITLTIGSADMGQGSFQGLAQILGEDLMVSWSSIQLVQGEPTAGTPTLGNSIATYGSTITRLNYWTFRQAGATAREMLVQAAMNLVGDQTRSNYTVANGIITYTPTGQTIPYGQVAAAAALLPPPANAPLIPDSQFQLIGQTLPRQDIPSKVNGSAIYGLDIRLPNMVYAVVLHCPTFGGTLASVPATPAGTLAVVPLQVVAGLGRGTDAVGNTYAVAVVATNTWDAWQAVDSMAVSWNLPANASSLTDSTILSQAQNLLGSAATPYVAGGANPPGTLYTVEGNAAATSKAYSTAPIKRSTTYTLPYIAHNYMEVLNCTVNYVPGVSCDVYAPTQSAQSIIGLVTQLTGLAATQVNVHTTYLGGGLGRKLELDFISQAIQIAMAIGQPVKLMWPREQDFTHGQYRPMAVVQTQVGLSSTGAISSWYYRHVSESILAQRGVPLGPTGDSQAYEGSNGLPYKFANFVTEYVTHPCPLPVGFWRSVGNSINIFAVEQSIDDAAIHSNQDPYLFRLNLLTDPRWINVLQTVAGMANWTAGPAPGTYNGIAIGEIWNSVVGMVVNISNVTSTSIQVNNVWMAIDCYLTVNPGQVQAQLIGGMVHGLNAALYGRQSFTKGVPLNSNFHTCPVIRMKSMPQVAVTIIPSPAQSDPAVPIGGVGELGVPMIAPALANAYFKATGQRITTLPLYPNATMLGLSSSGI